MPWFQFGRDEGYPTHYSDQHSPAHIDVLTSGFILAFVLLGICLLCLLPAYNGTKRWIFFSQVVISLCIGGIVVVGNLGSSWEVGTVQITSAYKAGTGAEIYGKLGLHIALRGVNITLKGKPKNVNEFGHEVIDYNERFSWEWTQGRFGFGYYAGRFNREYRAAVYRGLPIPILQLAEYFTFDGEGVRFGRHYKTAGYYAHIMMWLAFPTWLISNILFCVIVRYATMFLISTGIFQLIAILIWTFVRNSIELQVPFEHGQKEVILSTSFGPDYYLVFLNGVICVVLGMAIFVLDMFIPDEMCTYFGIDPLTIYDEYHLSKEEIEDDKRKKAEETQNNYNQTSAASMNAVEHGESQGAGVQQVAPITDNDSSRLVLKRRTIAGSKIFQRSFKLKEKPRIKPRAKPAKVTNEHELTVRTPLLRVPDASRAGDQHSGSSADEDVESHSQFQPGRDYTNFPVKSYQASSSSPRS